MSEWLLRDTRDQARVYHPSTEAALRLLQPLFTEGFCPSAIADIGCGSGLLTLAAATWWPEARITACDISAQAVADCTENIAYNGVAERVTVLRSDGFSHPMVYKPAGYDLIIANLLAEILVSTAKNLSETLAPAGRAICSGILAWLRAEVEAAYAATGLALEAETIVGHWHALRFIRAL